MIKGRPPRLDQIFQSYAPPLFFVTIGTLHRRKIANLDNAHAAFRTYAQRAIEFNIAVGRYVMMPDHVHFAERLKLCAKMAIRIGEPSAAWLGKLRKRMALSGRNRPN